MCHGDGVPEAILTTQTMRKDNKGPLKNAKVSTLWRPHAQQPKKHGRHLDRIEGARYLRRPSAVANAAGKARITELGEQCPDPYDEEIVSEEDEPMPDEFDEADTGWRAGAAPRERLPFLSPTPGPKNQDLSWSSSYSAIMAELITPAFMAKWVERSLEHVVAWRAAHPGWKKLASERCVKNLGAVRWHCAHAQAYASWHVHGFGCCRQHCQPRQRRLSAHHAAHGA